MMIAITGANGFIGKELIKQLSKKNEKIRGLALKGEDTKELRSYGVEIIYGDVLNKATVTDFVKGAKCVIHLAAVVTSDDAKRLYDVNFEGTRNIVGACKKKKVKHILFMSSIAAVAKHLGPYGKSKIDAEQIVKESGLDYTILRPTLVYGKKGQEFNEIVNLIKKLPLIPLIGGGKAKKQPVYLEDLAELMVKILYSKKSLNKTYEIGGAEQVSFAELVNQVCDGLNIKRAKVYVPFFICLMTSKVLKKILKNPPLTEDQVLALENDSVADMSLLEKDFDFKPITLKEGLKKALET